MCKNQSCHNVLDGPKFILPDLVLFIKDINRNFFAIFFRTIDGAKVSFC